MTVKNIARSNSSHFESAHIDLQLAIDSDRTEQVCAILKNSDLINRPLPNALLPLHYAIRRGKSELVKTLLKDVTVDLKSKDNQGLSAVDHAMIGSDLKTIELILGQVIGRELSAALSWNMSILQKIQVQSLSMEVENLSPKWQQFKYLSSLNRAARDGDLANVQKHLDSKDPNPYDLHGMTPLHHAVLAGKVEVAKWLIEKGFAKTEIFTQNGLSLLHLASVSGNTELVTYLIKTDHMNPNISDRVGRTPLHYAMALEDLSAAKVLIQNGADPVTTNNGLVSPIQVAFSMANGRSMERDPLGIRPADCVMFAGILLSWAARISGVSQDLPFITMVLGALWKTLDNFKSSPPAFLAYAVTAGIGSGIYDAHTSRYAVTFQGHHWGYGIDWQGNSIPRSFLALAAGLTATTGYQVAKSSIKGLSNAWKNRSLETLRPLRNAIVHSAISAHAVYETANGLSLLYEQNKIFNAWDRYMDVERQSFQQFGPSLQVTIARKISLIDIFWKKYQYEEFTDLGGSNGHFSSDRSISPICNGKSEKECILQGNIEPKLSAIDCPPGQDSCVIGDQGSPRPIPKRDVRAKAAALLQLKEGYTDKDVKDSYKALAKKHAPDKVSCPNCTEEELKELKNQAQDLHANLGLAYKLLS